MLTKEKLPGYPEAGEAFEKKDSVISNGQELKYSAITNEWVFHDKAGEPEASAVTYSFILETQEQSNRPVMFVVEGGPGASCADMTISMYGPKIYDFEGKELIKSKAPYHYKDNDDWILDTCDIVMIDPVGAGFGRIIKEEAKEKFFGHEQDNYALALLIDAWLVKYGRVNSPKFLNGVSYGGQRCNLLPRYLLGGLSIPGGITPNITLNGIIQMADVSLIDTNADEAAGESVPSICADTPDICLSAATFAAINAYHRPEGKPDPMSFAEQAYTFGCDILRPLLLKKETTTEEEKRSAAEKLSYFIGVPADTILAMNFNLDTFSFCHMLALADKGMAVGFYDGRYTLPAGAMTSPTVDMIADDGLLCVSWPAVYALASEIYKKEFGISFSDGRFFTNTNFDAYMSWDWHIAENTRPVDWQLYNMRHCPNLHLMIVNGLYDSVWGYGYSRFTYENMGLPKDRTVFKSYRAGHEMYFDEACRHQMAADFREFIQNAI